MKTAKKVAIILSVCSICAGILISFIAMTSLNFDFKQLNTINFKSKTYTVEEDFTNISIIGAECKVKILPTDERETTVKCDESDKIYHKVRVYNDALTIERIDDRQWYEHFGIYWAEMELTVYLPKQEYDNLRIVTLSGDIEIPSNISFTEASVNSTSGDISFFANVRNSLDIHSVSGDTRVSNISAEDLKIQATSGDIEISKIKVGKKIELKTVSGEIEGANITCRNLISNSTSGDAEFEYLIAEEKIKINTVSGEIGLEKCDSDTLELQSTSGNVRGTLLSGKDFHTDTTSGNVNVPRSDGGTCNIKTTSGNIHMEISE